MPAGCYDFICEQGATFKPVLTWKDSAGAAINLTGYTARMQVRSQETNDLILDCAAYIALGGVAGTITFSVPAAITAALAAGKYKYDLELESSGGIVDRILNGYFTVDGEITV